MDKQRLNLQERSHPCVMWFRRDLRIDDQPTLQAAQKLSKGRVICVYCLDPREYESNEIGWPKCGAYRAQFLIETLTDLRSKLIRLGSNLIILRGRPEEVLVDLASRHGATHIVSQDPVSYDESEQIKRVQDQCVRENIEYREIEGATLYRVDRIPYELNALPTDFIRYRREVERESTPIPPEQAITKLLPLPLGVKPGPMLTLEDLGLSEFTPDPRTTLPFVGGEANGLKRLKDYLWDRRLIGYYYTARYALGGEQVTTKLSPWISLGCLSPRRIWYELLAFELKHGESLGIYQVIYQLILRDFLIFQSRKYGARFYQLNGLRGERPTVEDNQDIFGLWWQGYTGFPLVDACMRELATTGYLSPQGRLLVAGFLTQHLKLPWTWGASCFETLLIDYNPATTWGMFQSLAGVGVQLPIRALHPLEFGQKIDPEGAYVRYWVPELAHLPAEYIYEPYRLDEGHQAHYGVLLNQTYPYPVIAPPPLEGHLAQARQYEKTIDRVKERGQRQV